MFPKNMNRKDIQDLIMEACDSGTIQGNKITYKLNPSKNGISEMEVYFDPIEKVIRTAYPTKGSQVWKFPELVE
jgi:hypothetical protein